MNTQGSHIRHDNHFHLNRNEVWDERKIRAVEEEIELLREQVESLKREQQCGYELAHECLQELEETNKEVELMNEEISNLINSKKLPIEQAKQWAKSIIKNDASISEPLSELLSAIYGYPVNLNEGEDIKSLSLRSELDNSKVHSREIQAKSKEVAARSSKIKGISDQITARSREIRVRSHEVKAHSGEVRNQLGSEKVSHTTLKIYNLSDAIAPRGDRGIGA